MADSKKLYEEMDKETDAPGGASAWKTKGKSAGKSGRKEQEQDGGGGKGGGKRRTQQGSSGQKRRVASSRLSVPLALTVKSVIGSRAAQSCEGCAAV